MLEHNSPEHLLLGFWVSVKMKEREAIRETKNLDHFGWCSMCSIAGQRPENGYSYEYVNDIALSTHYGTSRGGRTKRSTSRVPARFL
ncbi:hypothetical protein SBA1_1420016 [Candidatus Sulfotelmatobacter kueseliae]|uniref:Uncharacterized protein n=1 Tax=Candidatus Sulfotelmatobacter kueseliae TaxID=2042962 RepID=A0A2U3K7Z3_9BACT|nr:hypothetical protein SBA1_1420016 [Candidatus Sulfotelmatobacter kueseliae]